MYGRGTASLLFSTSLVLVDMSLRHFRSGHSAFAIILSLTLIVCSLGRAVKSHISTMAGLLSIALRGVIIEAC